jgi:hypothetical protein
MKTGKREDRKARLVSILESIANGACSISYLIQDIKTRLPAILGNNYGLKLNEPGWFPGRAEHWAQAVKLYIQIIAIAAPAITVATIITTSVHFAVDKLGKIDDEVLVVASSKPEVENARGERDRARYVRRNKFYSYSR